jgi:mannose-6-phosphate isomerase
MDQFELIEEEIKQNELAIATYDFNRPWGGFFVFEEWQAQMFANVYFDKLDVEILKVSGKLSPKLLVVRPGARLSWQYHLRRAETWRVIKGPVGIVRSLDDLQGSVNIVQSGESIVLKQGERHRLIGLEDWGIVAEFWQHTDALYPSDEEDIVRVQDDYSRE